MATACERSPSLRTGNFSLPDTAPMSRPCLPADTLRSGTSSRGLYRGQSCAPPSKLRGGGWLALLVSSAESYGPRSKLGGAVGRALAEAKIGTHSLIAPTALFLRDLASTNRHPLGDVLSRRFGETRWLRLNPIH